MAEPQKIRKSAPSAPALQSRQMTIAFESSVLRGLTEPERAKALAHLAYLLMLAAGIAPEEYNDER